VAAALGASGRQAVAGSESQFARSAVHAFARGNAKLIGSLTRDRPFGAISAGDRAGLAWERVPPEGQAAFAEDFLSTWLGGGTAEPASIHAAPGPMHLVLETAEP
jgi:hypothetical protein